MRLADYMFGGFDEPKRDRAAEKIIKKLIKKYGEPEVGTTRAAFIGRNFVFKFPINESGERANDWEGSCRDDIYAKGRWIKFENFICVMQERLTLAGDEPLPDWVNGIDGGQVGYDRNGNLKAYDFGR